MSVKPTPDGYRSITPYLSIEGAAAAIDFYQQAFGATELFRMPTPSGGIGHAEIKIGDSTIMLADPCEEETFRSPRSLGGSPVGLHLYVEDETRSLPKPSRPRQRPSSRWKTASTAIAMVPSKTHSDTFGSSLPTKKTSRRKRSTNGPRSSLPRRTPDTVSTGCGALP